MNITIGDCVELINFSCFCNECEDFTKARYGVVINDSKNDYYIKYDVGDKTLFITLPKEWVAKARYESYTVEDVI